MGVVFNNQNSAKEFFFTAANQLAIKYEHFIAQRTFVVVFFFQQQKHWPLSYSKYSELYYGAVVSNAAFDSRLGGTSSTTALHGCFPSS